MFQQHQPARPMTTTCKTKQNYSSYLTIKNRHLPISPSAATKNKSLYHEMSPEVLTQAASTAVVDVLSNPTNQKPLISILENDKIIRSGSISQNSNNFVQNLKPISTISVAQPLTVHQQIMNHDIQSARTLDKNADAEANEILSDFESVLEVRRISEPSHQLHLDEINKNKKELMRKMMKFNTGVSLQSRLRQKVPKTDIAIPSVAIRKIQNKKSITVKNIILNSDMVQET